MVKKAKLIEVLDYGSGEMHNFIDSLSVEQRMETGAVDRWSVKDVVAHFTVWTARLVSDLELAAQPEAAQHVQPNYGETDDANAEIYAQYKEVPWEEILAQMEATYSAVRGFAMAATDQELDDRQPIPWREARPLWRMLVGSAVEHPLLHLGYYHIGKGNLAEAARLQETLAARMLDLDDSPGWRGTQVYNLACIRALSGQKEIALANLAEAFQLAPELIEWSKKDPDLDGLRPDPAFEALYAA
jgi:tetratricopeptide (TPR) repeat protein